MIFSGARRARVPSLVKLASLFCQSACWNFYIVISLALSSGTDAQTALQRRRLQLVRKTELLATTRPATRRAWRTTEERGPSASHELARTRSARSPIPKKQDREVGPAGARAHPYTPNPTSHALSSANGARTSCCSHPLPCPLSNSSNSSRRPSLRLQVPVARCSGLPHLRRCSLRRLSAARRTVTCTHLHGRVAGRHLVEEL